MEYRLIALDLDGTLLNSRKEISPRTRQALRLARERGIVTVIALGDSDNDLEMLRYAGVGVAMGNAAPHIRDAADRVTASCDEDGVAIAIEELCLS